jgi:hypothetical protein
MDNVIKISPDDDGRCPRVRRDPSWRFIGAQSSYDLPGNVSGMKKILTVAGILVLCMTLALVAGCSQPEKPVVTPEPTAVPDTIATAEPTAMPTKLSLTPGPTQTLPDMWSLDVQVTSNGEAINPLVIVALRGGKGMNLVPSLDIKVTRSDGVVETSKMTSPLYVGKTVELAGTTKPSDRCEIWANPPNGEPVKIYDDYVCFRCY